MDYLTFRNHLYAQGCFNINQVLLWEKDFDRNNLTRWCHKGLLVKLRNKHYAFPEYRQMPGFSRIVANRIYSPSYVSLQSALSFYGMIPEEVIGLTSVTTLKTTHFDNPFGSFHYQNVKESLYFGYDIKMMEGGRGVLIATPEKAILDLLYLNPFYETEQDMEELRLDEDYMQNELDMDRLSDFLDRFGSLALKKRIFRLKTVYAL
ncbi:MAG: hypothetical protein ACI3ZH_05750 [Candidatus Cryptobacteroides sp.]